MSQAGAQCAAQGSGFRAAKAWRDDNSTVQIGGEEIKIAQPRQNRKKKVKGRIYQKMKKAGDEDGDVEDVLEDIAEDKVVKIAQSQASAAKLVPRLCFPCHAGSGSHARDALRRGARGPLETNASSWTGRTSRLDAWVTSGWVRTGRSWRWR